jgi:hypothetical protein
LERLAAEAEEAFNSLVDKSPTTKTNLDDPLAAKKIERLFKTSGSEKSPFAS